MSDETNTIEDLSAFLTDTPVESEDSQEEQPDDVENVDVEEEAPEEDESEEGEESDSELDDDEDDSTMNEDDEDDEDDSGVAPSLSDEDEVTLTIDGEEVTVKGDELKSGYMRQAAFTKKTQEVAEKRKEVEAKEAKVAEQAEMVGFQAHKRIADLEAAVTQAGGWANIKANYKPEEVEQFTNMYTQAQQEAQMADGMIEEYNKQKQEANKAAIIETFKQLASTNSDFNNNTVSELNTYLSDLGMDNDAILSITSPVHWDMIYKAMKYDKAQAKIKTPKKKASTKSHKVPSKRAPIESKGKRKLQKAIKAQAESRGTQNNSKATQDALMAFLA